MTVYSYSRTEDYLVYTPGHRNFKSHPGVRPTTNNALGETMGLGYDNDFEWEKGN